MNKPEVSSKTATAPVQTGCCGSERADEHAAPSSEHAAHHDHGRHAASKTGASSKATDRQTSGRGSGCCCS